MIPSRYSPPLPMRFWRGNRHYEIRAASCGHRYIGSCNGEDIAIAADPAVVMRLLVEWGSAVHKKQKMN